MGDTPGKVNIMGLPHSQSVENLQITHVRPHHTEIARRLVCGIIQADICKQLGMSPTRMSLIVNSPLMKLEIKRLSNERDIGAMDIKKELAAMAPNALAVAERTMYDTTDEKIRIQCAWGILDRAGHKATDKIEIKKISLTGKLHDYSDEELAKIIEGRLAKMKRAHEVKMAIPDAIDVTNEVKDDNGNGSNTRTTD